MITLGGIGLEEWREPNARDLVAEAGLRLGSPPDAAYEKSETCDGTIRLTLHHAESQASQDPALEGFLPTFYQGIVQAYTSPPERPRETLLWDRRTRIFVREADAHIEGFVSEEEVVRGSAATTLEIALALALRLFGRFHLHAAAVVHPKGHSMLLVGSSGSGKTTATIALLEAGFCYLSDDALILAARPDIQISAFPRHFHVGPRTAATFPRLQPIMQEAPGYRDKRSLDPRIAFPGQAKPFCTAPRLVLYPTIDPAEVTTIEPISKAEGLGHLITSSAGLVIDGAAQKPEHLALLSRLANEASHYALHLGSDLLCNPRGFADAIAAL